LDGHFDADEDQEGPKDIDDPVKSLNQRDPGNDEDGSQDNGTENSPEEDLMLIARGDFEVGEDEQEDKDIVHAEGLFDQVTRQKLKRFLGAIPEVNSHIEEKCQGNPDSTPDEGFSNMDDMSLALENLQIQDEHCKDEKIKDHPE
jgi:hypothetical protein